MPTAPPQIELNWREEDYGSVAAVAAFRNYNGTTDWTARQHQRFRGCLKRAGFEFHFGRCSYIASSGTKEDRKRAICSELVAAGFEILTGNCLVEEPSA